MIRPSSGAEELVSGLIRVLGRAQADAGRSA